MSWPSIRPDDDWPALLIRMSTPPKRGHGFSDQAFAVGVGGDVHGDDQRVAAGGADFFRRFRQRFRGGVRRS